MNRLKHPVSASRSITKKETLDDLKSRIKAAGGISKAPKDLVTKYKNIMTTVKPNQPNLKPALQKKRDNRDKKGLFPRGIRGSTKRI